MNKQLSKQQKNKRGPPAKKSNRGAPSRKSNKSNGRISSCRPRDDPIQSDFKQFYKKTSDAIIYQGELMCGFAAIKQNSNDGNILVLRELYKYCGPQLDLIDKCERISQEQSFPTLEQFKSKQLPELILFPTCLLNILQKISAQEKSNEISAQKLKIMIKFILSSYKLLTQEINDLIDRNMEPVFQCVDYWLRQGSIDHNSQEQQMEQQDDISYEQFLNKQGDLSKFRKKEQQQQMESEEQEDEAGKKKKKKNLSEKTEIAIAKQKYRNTAKILEPFTNWIYFSIKYCNLRCKI